MRSVVYNDDYRNVTNRYPDKYFDLLVADIPYGIDVANMPYLKEIGTTVKQKNGNRLNGNANKKVHFNSDWDKQAPSQDYFDEAVRISKNQIIFGVEYVDWEGLGNGRIKWNKGVAEGMSFKKYEMAYCSMVDDVVELDLLWAGMCQAKSLSEPMVQRGNKKTNEKRIHPCHKPTLLYDRLFLDYGFKGMKVIDTHLGGGMIRMSADRFGVEEFIGCEIEERYFYAHELKWKEYKSQLSCNFQ
jgi:site-specific DNA-methyltransferase (adenine-specific)